VKKHKLYSAQAVYGRGNGTFNNETYYVRNYGGEENDYE